MKRILLSFSILFLTYSAFATHGMGGEITWSCDGLGNYIFQVKFYRDCNGIIGPDSVIINSNVPGVPTISCLKVSQIDISPSGDNFSGNTPCYTCMQGSSGNPLPGLVEEFTYASAPVSLPGVPPVDGWAFSYGDCCRSSLVTNISNAGTFGYSLRTLMYPFPGQAQGMCSDNSPYFAERPSVIICTGYPFTYNHLAIDPEADSLNYSWESPVTEALYPWDPIPFAPGYSIDSQLPGTLQNPNNIPATLNHETGEFAYQSFTQGYFTTVIGVSTYKCGVKVAEIFREINVVLISGCTIPVGGTPLNNPPLISPPFPDSSGNPMMLYNTYVHAGDTVNFVFATQDFDPNPVTGQQFVAIKASGQEYGTGFTDPANGCLIPPCATLNPPPPYSAIFGTLTEFNWKTTTAHLGLNYGCVYFGNRYYFVIKAQDNYCPANAISNATISITVLPNTPAPQVTFGGGQLTCLTGGNYSYQWFLNRYAIGGATSQFYTPVIVGYYQVLAVNNTTGDGNYSAGIDIITLGIENPARNVSEFSVFPNPSHEGMFKINFSLAEKENISISFKDIFGRSFSEKQFNGFIGKYSDELNLSAFSKGIYILELKTEHGIIDKKLILF